MSHGASTYADCARQVMHAQYHEIGQQEGRHIRAINAADPDDVAHIVRCLNCFTIDRHYCIAFELMSTTPIRHCIDLAASRPSAGSGGGGGGGGGPTGLQLRVNAVRKVSPAVASGRHRTLENPIV
jgi:hypothetical protein